MKYKFKPRPVFYVWLFAIFWWFMVFQFGFFKTVLWTIISGAVTGIIIKLKENR